MDKIDVRLTAEQLADLIDALAKARENTHDDAQANRWTQLGGWLAHRYTRRWGLPPKAAAVLDAIRQ